MYKPGETAYSYQTAGITDGRSQGYGRAKLRIRDLHGKPVEIEFDAHYNPNMNFNLYCVRLARTNNLNWSTKDAIIRDWQTDRPISFTPIRRGVYCLDTFPCNPADDDVVAAAADVDKVILTHRRLGHVGIPKLKGSGTVDGQITAFVCETCRLAKAQRQPSREKQNLKNLDYDDPGSIWYVDLQHHQPDGFGGYKHYMVCVNGATRMSVPFMLKNKAEASAKLLQFMEYLKLQTGTYPRAVLADGGKEFLRFRTVAIAKGIFVKVTAPRTPEPNGSSERFGGYLNSIARSAIIDSGLPECFWPFAIENSAYIVNRLPRMADKDQRAPIRRWREYFKRDDPDPPLAHLKVFGCRTWVHIPKEDRIVSHKMAPRARLGYLVGYEGDHGHLFKIWIPGEKRIFRSRDVTFDETRVFKDDYPEGYKGQDVPVLKEEIPVEDTPGAVVEIQLTTENPKAARDPAPNGGVQEESRKSPNEEIDPMEGIEVTGPNLDTRLLATPPQTPQASRKRTMEPPSFTPRETPPTRFLARGQSAIKDSHPPPSAVMTQRPAQESRSNNVQPLPSLSYPIGERPFLPQAFFDLRITNEPRSARMAALFGEDSGIRTANVLQIEGSQPQQEAQVQAQEPEDIEIQLASRPPSPQAPPNPSQTVGRKRGRPPKERHPDEPVEKEKFTDGRATQAPERSGKAARLSHRNNKGIPPSWYGDEQAMAAVSKVAATTDVVDPSERIRASEVRIPQSYREAMNSPYADRWSAAMNVQMADIRRMKAYVVVERPKRGEASVLPGKWVYAVKLDKENFVCRFKARWVICGNNQRPGIDFYDSSAPVPSDAAVRMFLTMVAILHKSCRQVDVVTAYLHAALKQHKIYMRQPPGFESPAGDGEVWLLLMALYGLRQAGHLWFKEIRKKLMDMGFKPLQEEPCIYRRGSAYILIWVDDLLIADDTEESIDAIQKELSTSFNLKIIGEPARFLGCAITRDRQKGTITMSQDAYANDILAEYGMGSCSGSDIPMHPAYRGHRVKLARQQAVTEDDEEDEEDDAGTAQASDYTCILGRLNWLVTKTRVDIAHAVFQLQRHMKEPLKYDVKAVKTLLRYLKRRRHALKLASDHSVGMEVYVDAAHQDHADGKSTEAYVVLYAGCPVSWSSKKETIVAPSTTVAELIAFDRTVKEALFIRKLALALNLPIPDGPIEISTDSLNAINVFKKVGFDSTTKWLDNRFLFVKDFIEKGDIQFRHIDGTSNPADGLTKPLDSIQFDKFVEMLGLAVVDTGNEEEHGAED
jgi:hypothetical protein